MSHKSKAIELMKRIDSLEKELDMFNIKYRELQSKYKKAIEIIQKFAK